ncbi:thioredoxin-disulfide reductase [Dysosmobacter sp.]|uniref:thioredoxin-disulfide reductase n=1 Tax=Dysosmobacter sp. TaxID=2591382 RepID=UPI003AEF94D1
MEQIYDMIIIGGGPAGYTAALYAARAGLSTLVLEKLSAGGQMALTEQIDNYPGFEDGIDGFTLGEKMQQSAERFGAVTELAEVYKVSLSGKIKTLDTSEGVFQSSTVVIATGASPRPLGVPGEEALIGKGVHYCAACDGAPYRGKTVVVVVGGGNSAAADALTLSRIAQKVYLIHRRDSLRATKVYHAPLMAAPNVEFCWNSTVSALLHESRLTGLRLKDVNTGAERDLACDGVFISVGRAPATELFQGELALDKSGYIIADESTRTSIPGVFAVGDVRTKALRQVVTAVSDGAVAVHYAEEYLAENR